MLMKTGVVRAVQQTYLPWEEWTRKGVAATWNS
jgi:hypothetical protein